MRPERFVAGLAVAVVCAGAPVAALAAPATPTTGPATPVGPVVPGPPGGSGGESVPSTTTTGPGTPTEPLPSVQYVVWGCVTQNATATRAPVRVIWGNGHMRTALRGAGAFTVGIDTGTSVRAGWSWQRRSHRAHSGRHGAAGLKAGDIITAFISARRGTAATALPAADLILDFGRFGGAGSCAPRR